MEENSIDMNQIRSYFAGKLELHGATPRGVDWNSTDSQEIRFAQLSKVIPDLEKPFSLLDFGSGFGSYYDYLITQKAAIVKYIGFDIVEGMVVKGREMHSGMTGVEFSSKDEDLSPCDFAVASGIFNIKLDTLHDEWTDYVIKTLSRMNELSTRGFSFNLLTKYSDSDHMRPDLYYADPGMIFDVCKRKYSRNVAILHDYDLYDFTVIVRKQLD
jgi:hypothetical protein